VRDDNNDNRREFLRLKLDLPVDLRRICREGAVPERDWLSGQMVEIGGGGARLLCPVELGQGDVLCIRFTIPDTHEMIKAYARVVGMCGGDDGICVKFVELSETERGMILRYAFREQIRRYKGYTMEAESKSIKRSGHDESGSDN